MNSSRVFAIVVSILAATTLTSSWVHADMGSDNLTQTSTLGFTPASVNPPPGTPFTAMGMDGPVTYLMTITPSGFQFQLNLQASSTGGGATPSGTITITDQDSTFAFTNVVVEPTRGQSWPVSVVSFDSDSFTLNLPAVAFGDDTPIDLSALVGITQQAAVHLASAPEPATYAVLAGMLGLGALMSRAKRARAKI